MTKKPAVCAGYLLAMAFLSFVLFSCRSGRVIPIREAPYPHSSLIKGIHWQIEKITRLAPGSDIWTTTWAANDHLYTSWGDGGGFGGDNFKGRVSMGVARIEGGPRDLRAFNVWGGLSPESKQQAIEGKATGMLAVNGVIYLSVSREGVWTESKVIRSTDLGQTWISGEWDFQAPFANPAFLNFGRDYDQARDKYVYSYARDLSDPTSLILARVPVDHVTKRDAYEFFAGNDATGRPAWTADVGKRRAVFRNRSGIGWGVRVVHNPGLNRYLLSVFHGTAEHGDGSWGLFDAPEPWGPWTTVTYYTHWIDSTPKFGVEIPAKWIGNHGQTLWLVFSGTGVYDSFNLVQGQLLLQ